MKPFSTVKRRMGVFIAVGILCFAIAGCSPQQSSGNAAASSEGGDKAETVQTTWSMDMDCAMCHADQNASMEDEALIACIHATEAQATCTTCHTDESALSAAHENATATSTMPKKLKKTEVSAETCQASECHDESADEFTALTAAVTELTDSRGTMVNPHEVMGLTEGHVDIVCNDCHTVHDEGTSAAETCVSCHHAGVYECNTCH